MYDNTCKFLAENFPTDFASWLLGKPIPLTKLEASELSVEPIRADSVILLESAEIIVHLEFQTKTDETMAFRMLDYWVRLYRKYPTKKIHQTVIYLKPTNSPLAYQNGFNVDQTSHSFNVMRLWEQPTEIFQQYQGLLPFAVLSQTKNAEETLRQVVRLIDNIADKRMQSNVAASTAIMSGIALSKEIIQRLLRSEIMKESVIYQEILLEGEIKGEIKGKAEGLAKGKAEERNQIALKMFRSNVSVNLIAEFTGLTLKQIEKLQKLSTKQSKSTKSPKAKKSSKL
jgi:predicted transposase/invertase (TIGR01784 family)